MEKSHQPHVWLDATGIENFKERFPTIYQSCLENGIDPTKQLIPVAPASHYASGGVLVDLQGHSSVPGLYICGESACTGAHGANRLASNSLLEGLVFGARIAADIAAHRSQAGDPIDDNESTILLSSAIRLPLQLAMSEGAGVVRSRESLTRTLATLKELGTHSTTDQSIESWEATNLYQLATAVAQGALAREESRGSHRRSDFLESSPTWRRRIVQALKNGEWQMRFVEVGQ